MHLLERRADPWGEVSYRDENPVIRTFEDAVFVPFRSREKTFGLFDGSGGIIEESLDRCGVKRTPHRIDPNWTIDPDEFEETIEEELLYVGFLDAHFGHWLVNSLSRFWPLLDARWQEIGLIGHAPVDVAGLLAKGFVRESLHPLGVDPNRILLPQRRVRLRRVRVPAHSLDEQARVHRIYGELCRRIGAACWTPDDVNRDERPLYISKARVPNCFQRMACEEEIEAEAARRGFAIFHPETVSLPEQIATLSRHRRITGSIGSAFHLIPFAAPGRIVSLLNPGANVNSNYLLLDQVSDPQVDYLTIKRPYVRSARMIGGPHGNLHHIERSDEVIREYLDAALPG